MSIRLVVPPSALAARIAPEQIHSRCRAFANDNGTQRNIDAHLQAALRHFSVHGLAAASNAAQQAALCARTGNGRGYEEWLGICNILDRRLARDMAKDMVKDMVGGLEHNVADDLLRQAIGSARANL